MYQDLTTTDAVQPTAVYPAQLAPYIPAPQPTMIPGRNGQPGVIVDVNGQAYYGHPPIIYAQQQPLGVDPQAAARAVERIGQGAQLLGAGGFAAGAGFGASELIGAVAGASVGTLIAAAAVIAVAKLKAPRVSTVNNIREEYHQHVTAVATGWFGRAGGEIRNEKTFNSNQS